jgi:ribosomal protein L32E
MQIGYGSNRKTRHLLPNGLKKFLVHNVRELDLLLMHNKTFTAEIAHGVSSRHRIELVERYVSMCSLGMSLYDVGSYVVVLAADSAKVLNVKVTNPAAKLRSEE